MSIWGIATSILAGWLASAVVNWAADHLPDKNFQAIRSRQAPFALRHYLTLWWYFSRGGVCPHCGEKRPWRVPLVEAVSVGLFLLAWRSFGDDPLTLALLWLYAAFLLTVLVIDLEHRRVLNKMVLPGAVAALAFSFLPGPPSPWQALLGGLIGFGLFLVIAFIGRGAMGAGDVKLAGLIGLMVGYPNVIPALVIGIVLGGAAALALLLSRRAGRKSTMAYAPYLALGALLTLWGTLGG